MRDYKKLSLTLAILSGCLSASAQAVNDSVYDEKQLQGVTVTAVKRKGSTNAAVLEMKKSANVVSTISAQEISLTQDNNAGEVIRRVPGVSIIDGKFVMVRGLSQRP